MKNKITILCLFLFCASFSYAQNKNKLDSWKELKDFHMVISQTFHPSEEGNLEPIKTRSAELKAKAIALAGSKIPAEFDNEKIKASVIKLKDASIFMDQMVAEKVSDKELKDQLIVVHDAFHEIVEKCVKGSEEPDGKKEEHKEVK